MALPFVLQSWSQLSVSFDLLSTSTVNQTRLANAEIRFAYPVGMHEVERS